MKVLMLAPEPFFQPRGTPFSILYRLRALHDLGCEVDLLTYPIGDDLALPGVTILRSPRFLGIQSVAIGPSIRKLILDFGLYREAKKRLLEGAYDVLHTHEEAAFFGTGLARNAGVPHVYDMHSQLSSQLKYYPFFRLSLFRRLFERCERKTICGADVVITISPSLLKVVRKIDPDSEAFLIENTLDGDDIGGWTGDGALGGDRTETVDIRGLYDLPRDSVLVVYAGSFEPYQGLDSLLESAGDVVAKCPRVHFLFLGGNEIEVNRMRKLGQSMGVTAHLRFAGTIEPRAVPGHLRGADILVSPRREGTNTPSKIYSYLKAGRAIVATNSEAHTQILDSDVAVLTDGTVGGMTKALVNIVGDETLRTRLREHSLGLARARCSYSSYLEATRRAYASLR